MKTRDAIRVARELQQYRDYGCKHFATPRSPERWVRQFATKRATKAEVKIGEGVMDVYKPYGSRKKCTRWVPIADIVSHQPCLSLRRLLFQLRRHPLKRKPSVIRLPSSKWLLWDGNHRVAAALLRGGRFVKVRHYWSK